MTSEECQLVEVARDPGIEELGENVSRLKAKMVVGKYES